MDGISSALHKQQTNPFPHMPSSSPHNDGQYEEIDNDEELSVIIVQKINNDKNLKKYVFTLKT